MRAGMGAGDDRRREERQLARNWSETSDGAGGGLEEFVTARPRVRRASVSRQ